MLRPKHCAHARSALTVGCWLYEMIEIDISVKCISGTHTLPESFRMVSMSQLIVSMHSVLEVLSSADMFDEKCVKHTLHRDLCLCCAKPEAAA